MKKNGNLTKKELVPLEREEHLALMKWIHLQPTIKDFVIHIPNEGKRSIIAGKFMVRMGLKAGVFDLFVAVPQGKYHGLWIELKRRKGFKISAEQLSWQALMRQKNYVAEFAYGWEHGREIIENYMYSLPTQ